MDILGMHDITAGLTGNDLVRADDKAHVNLTKGHSQRKMAHVTVQGNTELTDTASDQSNNSAMFSVQQVVPIAILFGIVFIILMNN